MFILDPTVAATGQDGSNNFEPLMTRLARNAGQLAPPPQAPTTVVHSATNPDQFSSPPDLSTLQADFLINLAERNLSGQTSIAQFQQDMRNAPRVQDPYTSEIERAERILNHATSPNIDNLPEGDPRRNVRPGISLATPLHVFAAPMHATTFSPHIATYAVQIDGYRAAKKVIMEGTGTWAEKTQQISNLAKQYPNAAGARTSTSIGHMITQGKPIAEQGGFARALRWGARASVGLTVWNVGKDWLDYSTPGWAKNIPILNRFTSSGNSETNARTRDPNYLFTRDSQSNQNSDKKFGGAMINTICTIGGALLGAWICRNGMGAKAGALMGQGFGNLLGNFLKGQYYNNKGLGSFFRIFGL